MTALVIPDRLPAITIMQPWASLIAIGAKSLETRGRACSYRGVAGVHAGKSTYWLDHFAGASRKTPQHRAIVKALKAAGFETWGDLPLGRIVAVADLTDRLPVVVGQFAEHAHKRFLLRATGGLGREVLRLAERAPAPGPGIHCYAFGCDAALSDDFTGQLPFGDFSPGRYALLFEDVTPLPEPVPCRGQQAVPWRASPEVTAHVRDQLQEVAA